MTRTTIAVGVVDNDRLSLEMLKRIVLQQPIFTLKWAVSDSAVAIQSCLDTASRPDVLLTDMALDGMSGAELCKLVHQMAPSVRFVGVTAFPQNADVIFRCTASVRHRSQGQLPGDTGSHRERDAPDPRPSRQQWRQWRQCQGRRQRRDAYSRHSPGHAAIIQKRIGDPTVLRTRSEHQRHHRPHADIQGNAPVVRRTRPCQASCPESNRGRGHLRTASPVRVIADA